LPDFAAASAKQWQELMVLDSRRWGELEREALQLLGAAVLYQAGSFAHFGSLLHEKWRLPQPLPRAGAYLGHEVEWLPFGLFLRPDEKIAQMHLASAAMRLPVALQKTIETHPGVEALLGNLWGVPSRHPHRQPDWLRCKIKDRFAKVKTLDHCGAGPLGATEEERLQHASTIVMVVRDDFGHGEEGGSGPGTYRGDRRGVLATLYTCRIIEAQQQLVSWAIECFK
jgi:hypothetical protein